MLICELPYIYMHILIYNKILRMCISCVLLNINIHNFHQNIVQFFLKIETFCFNLECLTIVARWAGNSHWYITYVGGLTRVKLQIKLDIDMSLVFYNLDILVWAKSVPYPWVLQQEFMGDNPGGVAHAPTLGSRKRIGSSKKDIFLWRGGIDSIFDIKHTKNIPTRNNGYV